MDTENANVGDKDCYKDPMDAVGFLYRTMVERDPSKRKVKPVDKPLQLLDFGDLDDSSDDSDFKIGDHEQESDNDDSGESSAGNEDNSEEEEEESTVAAAAVAPVPSTPVEPTPAEVPEVKEEVPPGGEPSAKGLKVSVGQLIERAMARQTTAKQRISDISTKKLKVQICSVCLGDISLFSKTVPRQGGGDKMTGEDEDEIVECDCCGVSVHEGCYGISDAETAVSTVSSSSTEPWFCDACKAGNMAPACELCPNAGGIFKETDVGKWVHLVCALYIPGVAFGDVDKLTPVTLFEMPYSRWGAKSCALCEDDRYSRTGVCIKCDAGMCRTYFHVTCAQREGLLSEASTEEDIADPFFAYCKLHSDKNISRSKRRNYLALQSQSKEKKLGEKPSSDEKARIERKLAWHRDKYLSAKEKRPQPWVPTQKMPRLLTTSPSACKKLLKKAELLGLSPQTHLPGAESMMDIRRKWHVPPAFSVEFVGYYLDRNNRMVSMQRRLDELLQQNSQLQEQEQNLREQYEKVVSEVETLRKDNTELHDKGMEYWKVMCDVSSKKYPLPDVLKPKRLCKSPNRSKRSDASGSVIMECGICHKSHDQHQLAKCDSCQLHYHLACLDPPLSRMPKKTKSQGWQCSECDKTEEDDHEEDVDPDAPRKLRVHAKGSGAKCSPGSEKGRRGRSRKRLPEDNTSVDEKTSETCISSGAEEKPETEASPRLTVVVRRARRSTELSYRKSKRRGTKRKSNQGSWTEDDEKTNEELEAKIPRHSTRRVSIDKDIKVECCRCSESGEPSNLVKCDECQRSFHFHCLNPPVRKTPKQRGYTWHCEDCDPTEDDELKDSAMKNSEGVEASAEPEIREEKGDSTPVYTVE